VSLTELELLAVTAALTEYLSLVEEGTIDQLMDEMEADSNTTPLTAAEALDLKSRFEALLEPKG
jgi:hypothetical protein